MVIVQAPTPLHGSSRKDDRAIRRVVDRDCSLVLGQRRPRDDTSGWRGRALIPVDFIAYESRQVVAPL